MGTRQSVTITHNINIGHRLSELPGKCEQPHGHGMIVHVTIGGPVSARGLLFNRDFTDLKNPIKEYLDTVWDHHLHVNGLDDWSHAVIHVTPQEAYDGFNEETVKALIDRPIERIPGLTMWQGDPTTENIARWIGEWVRDALLSEQLHVYYTTDMVHVEVEETPHNAASWTWVPDEAD